ncbi:MAG TPA: zinc chelation protein SecC [Herpetosiphon sp.]|uniref:SEC-C motif domain protein n=1 Tax=Herpetosiphon aurantiacus (strain ATCC 23779 / DSM 785 / 114-95) TaxID=316274 RepID=A9B844_HERA2|nr:SEC-C metal-binding domain-containing protein [Herpetosiphon sp.]ABX05977.1 SEC-C motif domain protein [Herpetosiphon aurantiacus DSM 785]HBW49518.1 zinc chelation protein SecC [Herpetosiphon sp.]
MAKVGRNDPCPCGSGKKYKQCHEAADRAQEDQLRLLRRAQDRLFPKLIDATQSDELALSMPTLFEQYWGGRYTAADMSELDELEDRGSERFLTWLAFDAQSGDDGSTLVERIAANPPAELELDEHELNLLPTWAGIRLRPYLITEIIKGKGALIQEVLTKETFTLRDHAAAKRLEENELIFAHLVPVGEEYYIAGAAAQTTPDTVEKLSEFLAVSLEAWQLRNPEADLNQFVRENSYLFNHFISVLPREAKEPSRFDDLMLRGRTALLMTKQSLGIGNDDDDDDDEFDDQADDDQVDDDDDQADNDQPDDDQPETLTDSDQQPSK